MVKGTCEVQGLVVRSRGEFRHPTPTPDSEACSFLLEEQGVTAEKAGNKDKVGEFILIGPANGASTTPKQSRWPSRKHRLFGFGLFLIITWRSPELGQIGWHKNNILPPGRHRSLPVGSHYA